MKNTVYAMDGKEAGSIELSDSVFSLPINDDVIYYAINNELANARMGTACTKDRGEVHGSNKKPYGQKGTGRARQGDKKSPIKVGGGTAFGPKPKDYSFSLNKKVKRLAMKSILSLKAQQSLIKVVKDFTVESGKTRDLVALLKNVSNGERTVIVLKDDDKMMKRAGKNVPWLSFLSYNRLRAHDLFYGKSVIILESAAKNLNEFYGDKAE